MKKTIWKIIFFSSLTILICAVSLMCYFLFVKDEVTINDIAIKKIVEHFSSEDATKNPIDFEALKEKNEDIYAWITVDGTDINYPILQSQPDVDDSYYLHHNLNKQYQFSGEIYTEKYNSKDFSDPNTVIIGHNMLNGTKFTQLLKFRNADFFEQNKYITIYLPNRILTYTIYSAYKFSDIHILSSYNMYDKKVFSNYLEMTLNPNSMIKNVREGINLSENDKIITLSTCIGTGSNRFIVNGVLTNDTVTK